MRRAVSVAAVASSILASAAFGVPISGRPRETHGVVLQVQQDEDAAEGMRALHRRMAADVAHLLEAARGDGVALIAGPAVDPALQLAGADTRTEKVTYLGVATNRVSGVLREQLKLAKGVGLVVEFIEKGSPAQDAGLQLHDIVEKFDDQWVVNQEQFTVLVRMKKAGEEATLTVVRGGERVPVKVKLGEKEVPITAEIEPALGGGVRPGGFLPEGFQLQPSGAAPGWNMQHATSQVQTDGSSVKHLVDDQHDIEITRTRQGPATVVVKNRAGKELYRGPYETADDKAKVPADLAAKVKRLDDGVPALTLSLSGRGNLAAQSVVFTRTDDAHIIGLRMDKDGKVLTVKDAKTGTVLFDGPINTDEERKSLPADVLPKLQAMEQRLGR